MLFITAARPARAIIDPDFTPVHVEKGAQFICTVTVSAVEDGKGATLAVAEVIKGTAPGKTVRLDFGPALAKEDGATAVKEAEALLRSAPPPRRALLVFGGYGDRRCGFLHVEGTWLRLDAGADAATVGLDRIDARLNPTFNGGTDMLIRTMQFITKYPGLPVMACTGGTEWSEYVLVGAVPGAARAVQAVDVNGDGRLDVFVACEKGDRVFLAGDGRKFAEMKGLDSASVAAAWADFDGDGRPDLASLGAGGLRLFLQTEPGKFKAQDVPLPVKVATASPTLDVMDADGDRKPDLVAGIGEPVVLMNEGGAKFAAGDRLMRHVVDDSSGHGAAGPCVVADFNNDGRAEVLEIRERGGRLYTVRPRDSVFGIPAPAAAMGKATDRLAAVGDFDGDGLLDVILAGGGRTPHLLQNRGGDFEQVMHLTGETSYIIQANAVCVAPGDFNADSFLDVFVGCEPAKQAQARIFFNRGFRTFGVCEPMKLDPERAEGAEGGQPAATWADLDASGSDDLLVALANGNVYWCISKVGEMEAPLAVRVKVAPKSNWVGPVVVTFHCKDRALGARSTRKFGPAALMNVPEPGRYEVRFTGPDGKPQSRTVDVEDKPVEVLIGE